MLSVSILNYTLHSTHYTLERSDATLHSSQCCKAI